MNELSKNVPAGTANRPGQTIWSILDEMRSGQIAPNTDALIERLSAFSTKPTPEEIWQLCLSLQNAANKQEKVSDPFISFMKSANSVWDFFSQEVEITSPLPSIVLDFAISYFSALNPSRLLSPWANEPVSHFTLLQGVNSLKESVALCLNSQRLWQAQFFAEITGKVLDWNKIVQWFQPELNKSVPEPKRLRRPGYFSIHEHGRHQESGRLEALAHLKGDFDAILCFTLIYGERNDDTKAFLLASASKLSSVGIGMFVLPSLFLVSSKKDSIYAEMANRGLAIDAVLSIPQESRGNLPGIDLAVVLVRRGTQENLFVGELQTDVERRKTLLKNLTKKQEVGNCSLGMLVSSESFKGFQAEKQKREYQTLIARQDLRLVSLADLLKETKLPDRKGEPSFTDRANSLYLPSIGFSETVTSCEQFRLKPLNYIQLVLNPDLVSADYLINFLNSDLGLHARRCLASGNFSSKISLAALRSGLQIPLPSLSIQNSVIEADTRLRDLATDIGNLRNQLWSRPVRIESVLKAIQRVNRENTFEEWLKGLPFPLASILWNYHSAAHDPKEQFELLLKFFEGLAEFTATILMSAARRDALLWKEVRAYLAKEGARERFESSTFSTWTQMSAFISKLLRDLYNHKGKDGEQSEQSGRARCEAAFGSSRSEVIGAFLSKQLIGVLGSANQFRNNYGGHYGVLGAETASNLLVPLRSFLSEARGSFGQAWESYQLVMPTDRSTWTGQYHETLVHVLQGPITPFVKESRQLTEPLKKDTLYLLDKDSETPLELLPLVKMSSAPREAANACYFYNRKQPDGTRYVSYHFEKQADMTYSAAEMENLFSELFGKQGHV